MSGELVFGGCEVVQIGLLLTLDSPSVKEMLRYRKRTGSKKPTERTQIPVSRDMLFR